MKVSELYAANSSVACILSSPSLPAEAEVLAIFPVGEQGAGDYPKEMVDFFKANSSSKIKHTCVGVSWKGAVNPEAYYIVWVEKEKVMQKLKPFLFKVEQYNNGEGYIGYYLVFALDTEEGIELLKRDPKYLRVCIGGTITINQVDDISTILHDFNQRSFELNYDCYN